MQYFISLVLIADVIDGEVTLSKYSNGDLISRNEDSYNALKNATDLHGISLEALHSEYDLYKDRFHSVVFSDSGLKENQIANANYHKNRYLRAISRCVELSPRRILDVGNDKPFFTWLVKQVLPDVKYDILSYPISETPYAYFYVDIEQPHWGISGQYDCILFLECLEHLWRDPAVPFFNINKLLRPGGLCYLTTPNACELHGLTNILWQSPPNQRGKIFPYLENGHPHLYTISMVTDLFEDHGFTVHEKGTFSPYGYTNFDNDVAEFAKKVSPFFDHMGESLEFLSIKSRQASDINRSLSVYETGEKCIS